MYPFYLQNVSKFCIYILKHSIFNCEIFQKIWEHTTFTFYKTQGHFISLPVSFDHRRRMEREGKAKVVASIWGANCVQFLAMLCSCFASVDFKETVEFKPTLRLALPSVSVLLLWL